MRTRSNQSWQMVWAALLLISALPAQRVRPPTTGHVPMGGAASLPGAPSPGGANVAAPMPTPGNPTPPASGATPPVLRPPGRPTLPFVRRTPVLPGPVGGRPTGGRGRPRPPGAPGAPRGAPPRPADHRSSGLHGGGTPFGLPYSVDRWENWWICNQDAYLDLSYRFAVRGETSEVHGDTFLGGLSDVRMASPVLLHHPRAAAWALPSLRAALTHPTGAVRAEAAIALGKVSADRESCALLMERVEDEDALVRRGAILGIGLNRHLLGLSTLHRVLLDDSASIGERAAAVVATGLHRDRTSLVPLAAVLHRKGRVPDELRAAAAYVLGFLDEPDAAAALREVIGDPDEGDGVAAAAVLGLGKSGDPAEAPFLLGLLEDERVSVRRSAAVALGAGSYQSPCWSKRAELQAVLDDGNARGTLDASARRALEDLVKEVEARAQADSAHLARLQMAVIVRLGRVLDRDSDAVARQFAAVALGRMASPAASSLLQEALRRGGSSATRGFVALALGISGTGAGARGLRGELGAGDPSVRSAVALALGLAGDHESADRLLQLLDETGDPEGRAAAAVALGVLGHQAAREPLLRAIREDHDIEDEVTPVLALALGLLGDREAVSVLERAVLTSRSSFRQAQALVALENLRDLDSVRVVVRVLGTSSLSDYSRIAAVRTLGVMAEKTARPALSSLAGDWNYTLPFAFVNDALLR